MSLESNFNHESELPLGLVNEKLTGFHRLGASETQPSPPLTPVLLSSSSADQLDPVACVIRKLQSRGFGSKDIETMRRWNHDRDPFYRGSEISHFNGLVQCMD